MNKPIESNPNENCLEGMACPSCGDFGPFRIDVTQSGLTVVTDMGTEFGVEGDTEWGDDATCVCMECSYRSVVREFRGGPKDPPSETFAGYLEHDGCRIDIGFEVPVGSTQEEKDLAFLAALAQIATVNYLAIGQD